MSGNGNQIIVINNPQEGKSILGPNGLPVERSEEFGRGWRDDHVTGGFFGGYDIWEGGLRAKRIGQLPASVLRDIYRKSSAVRPAVDQIGRSVAFAPWKLQPVEGYQADDEEIMSVKEFLKNPNRTNESFSQLLYKVLRDLLVLDVAVIEKVRNGEGKVVELFARDAATFTVNTDPTNSYITGFVQKLPIRKNGQHIRYETRHFPPQDIVWMVLNPSTDTQYGYPIIETIVNEVAALLFSMKSVARYFTHDEIHPGILVFGRLGRDAFDRAKDWFSSRKGEEGKRELPIFSDVESANYIPFQRPFREMQLAELSAQIERIVFRNFGVTSLEMGMTQDINRATAFSLERLSHSKLITPLRDMLSFFITQDIIWELNPGLEFRFSAVAKGDIPQVASSLVTLAGGPIISVNEAREEIGKESLEGFDFMTVHSGGQMVSPSTAEEKALKKDREAVAQEVASGLGDTDDGEEIVRAHSGLTAREYNKDMRALQEAYRAALEKEWLRLESAILRSIAGVLKTRDEGRASELLDEIWELLNDESLEKRFGPITEKFFGRSAELGDKRAVTQFRHPTSTGGKFYKQVGRDEGETFREKLIKRIQRFRDEQFGQFTDDLMRVGVKGLGVKATRESIEEALSEYFKKKAGPLYTITSALGRVRNFFDAASQALSHGGWKPFLQAAVEDGRRVYWIMKEGEDHCTPEKAAEYGYEWSCPELEAKSEAEDGLDPEWLLENDLTPRSGETPCGGHCYCKLELGPSMGPSLSAVAAETLGTMAVGTLFSPGAAARVLKIPQGAARAVTEDEVAMVKAMLSELHDDLLSRVEKMPVVIISDERPRQQIAYSTVVAGKEAGLKGKNREKLFATFSITRRTWRNPETEGWRIRHEFLHTTMVNPRLPGVQAKMDRYHNELLAIGLKATAHASGEGRKKMKWWQRVKGLWEWRTPWAVDEDVTQTLELYDPNIRTWAENVVSHSRRFPLCDG